LLQHISFLGEALALYNQYLSLFDATPDDLNSLAMTEKEANNRYQVRRWVGADGLVSATGLVAGKACGLASARHAMPAQWGCSYKQLWQSATANCCRTPQGNPLICLGGVLLLPAAVAQCPRLS
jgi:hypothetical protein